MRDLLAHRGPDGAGLWEHENVLLGHRRLAIRDLGVGGQQPLATPDGRHVLVYNGELYGEQDLRQQLTGMGVTLRSSCDSEVVLWALATMGEAALPLLRGMYALAWYDTLEQRLVLARDPLGMKPLYYRPGRDEIAFASELPALLAQPGQSVEPDLGMVSAYLSTVRSVLGRRTMFEGLRAMEPGSYMVWDARTGKSNVTSWHQGPASSNRPAREETAGFAARLQDSIEEHLVSDRPVAAFLSGGLDSSVVCQVTQARLGNLHTFCARAPEAEAPSEDGPMAELVAEALGTQHRSVVTDRKVFTEYWPHMVQRLGVPLSTPNEVAIYALSREVQAAGYPVVLSGEGADELLGGYELSLQAAWDHLVSGDPTLGGGAYQLHASAWVAREYKQRLLTQEAWEGAQGDRFLVDHYDRTFERCEDEVGPDAHPLEAHLRFLRHQNLPGLLQRLDTATMLASIEGRTPFSDVVFADYAEGLSMDHKFQPERQGAGGLAVAVSGKLILRQAWRGRIPAAVETRSKHSFPLPFQQWMGEAVPVLQRSRFAREVFQPDFLGAVGADPEQFWRFAWPMLNLALWGEQHWG